MTAAIPQRMQDPPGSRMTGVTSGSHGPSGMHMRSFVFAAVALGLTLSTAAADPAPVEARVVAGPPTAGTLIAAAVAAGDWRLHPESVAAQPWNASALFTIDVRGVRAGRSKLGLAATAVALVGALLIASDRKGSWCSGARCELGEAVLLVAAPLLDAAARGESDR